MTGDASTTSSPGALRRYVACCRGMTERDRRNGRRANLWLLAWMLAFLGTVLALKFDLLVGGVPTYLAIAATTVLGAVGLLAYVRFIREADELQRKIQLEALAIGFGAGFLATFTMSLLERVLPRPFEVGELFLVMVVAYVIGVFVGARRYA